MECLRRPIFQGVGRLLVSQLALKRRGRAGGNGGNFFFACSCSINARNEPIRADKKKIVFLGSPTVAAEVLEKLLVASRSDDSVFEVAAVVTQPPSGRSRGKRQIPSPVAVKALNMGFPAEHIFAPEKAGEEAFLTELRSLKPDICVTAAYGNILPKRFLEIPQKGTVNIHPSLLPLYRGAAPVQRALQDGVKVTGVSVAFTVHALDSGPVIAREEFEIDDKIKAPELLGILFDRGANIFLHEIPCILDGSSALKAKEQDDVVASYAPKVSMEESWLSFDQPATVLHNKVRAFAGWPGTRAKVQTFNDKQEVKILELKIISTRVGSNSCDTSDKSIKFERDVLLFCCGGGSTLEVLEVQLSGKKAIGARDFWNGLCGRRLLKA